MSWRRRVIKTNRTKPSIAKKAPKGTFSDGFDEKMNCFLVSMILGLAIGMEASASLGIGQKVDTGEIRLFIAVDHYYYSV